MLDRNAESQAQILEDFSCADIAALILILPLLAFSLTAIDIWHSGVSWHDQQRIYQLALLAAGTVLLIFNDQPGLLASAFAVLAVIFFLGLLSSLLSDWPLWALKEWGRYAGLLMLVLW